MFVLFSLLPLKKFVSKYNRVIVQKILFDNVSTNGLDYILRHDESLLGNTVKLRILRAKDQENKNTMLENVLDK